MLPELNLDDTDVGLLAGAPSEIDPIADELAFVQKLRETLDKKRDKSKQSDADRLDKMNLFKAVLEATGDKKQATAVTSDNALVKSLQEALKEEK